MAFTAYSEPAVLNLLFGGVALSAPATIYIALSTGLATAAVAEPSGGAYARVASTNNTTNWPNATGSNPATKSNGTVITFPAATANWGTIQSFAIYDAVSGGNLLVQGNLTTPQAVNTGATLSFAVGQLSVTLT